MPRPTAFSSRPTVAPYDQLYDRLLATFPPERLIADRLRLLAYGTDASFYRLTPKLVVLVETEAEVQALLAQAHQLATPVTFRAAGTSLSGQAVSDSVLVMLGEGWNGSEIAPDGSTIALQPGVIGAEANRRLAPYGRKIGPDPASINAARIGGIAANNASGMCCGTAQNSYQTLQSLRVVLADGAVLDSGDKASRRAFAATHGPLLDQLTALAAQAQADHDVAERIRRKFAIKNTTGYSLNALVDFSDPFDILAHLMIGSEGTLAFLSQVTYRTVPDYAHKATALLLFETVRGACQAVPVLGRGPVDAVELIDRAGLRAVQDQAGMPSDIRQLGPDATALLVETRAATPQELGENIAALTWLAQSCRLLHPVAFTTDATEIALLWSVRKGLFPSVGAVRKTGTTVIIEDVAFRVEDLAEAVADLHRLFVQHGYDEAIIFGHALAGNLHFVFTQAFDNQPEIDRYAAFMDEVCQLVVGRYDGSLKAEHGTGRNMAPYVELEWGQQAMALMRQIKQIFDPAGLLNPGVILNDDPQAHISHLKAMPAVMPSALGAVVDTCIECGFCEPKCPSHKLTLSPRQRITTRRELSRLAAEGLETDGLEQLYAYAGTETCAACGLCATACPVGIDTGMVTKILRGDQAGPMAARLSHQVAAHYGGVLAVARAGLRAAHGLRALVGEGTMIAAAAGLRRLTGGRTALWSAAMPTAARCEGVVPTLGLEKIVYFASCATRTFGPPADDPQAGPVPDRFLEVCGRVGLKVIPVHSGAQSGLCCGMPFESKGQFQDADAKAAALEQALLEASENGALAVAFDTSPCALRMRRYLESRGQATPLRILDVAEVAHDLILPRLDITTPEEAITVHLTCSTRRMGLEDKVLAVARACARSVVVPAEVGCCGFAGDKGFTTPELNAHALRHLTDSLGEEVRLGISTSRTCEIGLAAASGRPYRSLIHLLEQSSR
jgi:D-lactate dehydrogenase